MMVRVLASALLALLTGKAHAEICYGPAHPIGEAQPATATTVFQCPNAGSGTLTQLVATGWRVVRLTSIQSTGGASPQAADQLLLRADDHVFGNGFD
jgi:hypothetical protein